MIVVLDTNVILSSLLSSAGPPVQVIRAWESDEFSVATSLPWLAELQRVLDYPKVKRYFKHSAEIVKALLERFETVAIRVEPDFRLDVIKRDADDNRVLECAKAAGAQYIVSGDEDLEQLKEFEGIVILSPAQFMTVLKRRPKTQETGEE
jgi:uncharacterized protein